MSTNQNEYEYSVKYRYLKEDGYLSDSQVYYHATNTSVHKTAEKEVRKILSNKHKEVEIYSVTMV